MLLESIILKNFKQFKDQYIDLKDMRGRIGILGKTGAGKSTLLEGLSVALFGIEASRTDKEFLRTQDIEKEAVYTALIFVYDGKRFLVEREFKGKGLSASAAVYELIGDSREKRAEGSKECTSYIRSIINMDYSMFRSTVFSEQNELSLLSDMLPSKRKEFVFKLLNIDKFDKDIENIRKKKRDKNALLGIFQNDISSKSAVEARMLKVESEIENLSESKRELSVKLKDVEKRYNESEVLRKDYEDKYVQYNKMLFKQNETASRRSYLEKELSRLVKELDEVAGFKAFMNDKGNALEKQYNSFCSKLKQLEADRESFLKKEEILKKIEYLKSEGTKNKSELDEVTAAFEKLSYRAESLQALREKISGAEKSVDGVKSQSVLLEHTVNMIKDKLSTIKKDADEIKGMANANCPTCKQEIKESHIAILIEHYRKEYAKTDAECRNAISQFKEKTSSLKSLQAELVSLKDEEKTLLEGEKKYLQLLDKQKFIRKLYIDKRNEYKQQMELLSKFEGVKFDMTEFNTVKASRDSLEPEMREIFVIKDRISKAEVTARDIEDVTCQINENKAESLKISEGISALDFTMDFYIKVKGENEALKSEYLIVKENFAHVSATLESKVSSEKASAQRELSDIMRKEQDSQTVREDIENLEILEELATKRKNTIISKINPVLNRHLSSIFASLLSNKYEDIKLDKNYNIFIYDKNTPFPLERFSGGERAIANLSLRFAISKFIAEVYHGRMEFIALDEIFSALDDERRDSLVDVLGNLREHFKQILIISHEDSVKAGLDQTLYVEEDEYGYSNVSIA